MEPSSPIMWLPVLSAVVSLIALVVFFIMAGNVAAIKKHLLDVNDQHLIQEYLVAKQLGDSKRVYEAILNNYYKQLGATQWNSERIAIHKRLHERYSAEVARLGYDFPTEPEELK